MKHFSLLRSAKNPKKPAEEYSSFRELFDADFYLSRYPDVRASGASGWDHFLHHGMAEDRQPRADFDPVYYRRAHKDEIGEDIPFVHWATVGRAKGLRGHPWIDDPKTDEIALMRAEFNATHYLATNSDVARSGVDPFEHFVTLGWKENRSPNETFSINNYLNINPEIRSSGLNPFSHFVVIGRAQGRSSSLSSANDSEPLGTIDPFQYSLLESEFDHEFYLKQFAEAKSVPADAVRHYLLKGAAQGLDPNNWFSTRGYLLSNEDVRRSGINPFFHYLCQGVHEGRSYELKPGLCGEGTPGPAAFNARDMFAQHLDFTAPGPDHELFDPGILRSRTPRAKLLANYLPQFHAIPENDSWWGLGFTEWRNVVRGQPRYRGHQQPRVPEQLGFYDLNDSRVMKRQVQLARAAGLYGFNFYYYNFNGRRILEKPVEAFLADKSINFPFTLMWANENWTRTWDGFDHAVLLQQNYRQEDDARLLADVARHFADSRYVRIDGRPLFFIYRPGQIPEARARFKEWRARWEKDHGERPLIFMAQGFDDIDPRDYDLDGAIEFPPHKICKNMQPLNASLELFDSSFAGHVVSYAETVERSLSEQASEFPLIKTAVPSWDNEARRPGRGMTLQGATPARYERWLRALIEFSAEHPVFGERIVAVNAWNEWAEGAYIEPDVYHGAAYLNATARALVDAPPRVALAKPSILIVGHDAYRHGAQILVRNMAETFGQQFGFNVHLAICGEGPMLEEYRELATSCTTVKRHHIEESRRLADRLVEQGVRVAIVNTTVAGWITSSLKDAGFKIVSVIHELPQLIGEYKLEREATEIAADADAVVFPAELVRDSFIAISGELRGKVVVRPQGLYREDIRPASEEERRRTRLRLGFSPDAKLIINVGYADMRKGFDIFLRVARSLCARRPDVHFIWVGGGTTDAKIWQMFDIAETDFGERIQLTGYTENVVDFYTAADAFFLTSREDPFPSVVLEALAADLPVVSVRGRCGTNSLVDANGWLVDMNDDVALASALEAALERQSESRAPNKIVGERFRFDSYCFALAQLVHPDLPKVSVIVPNYNYGRYMETRLNSIFRQTHSVFEVIVLDDVSTDDSLDVISRVTRQAKRKIEIVTNETNSGSVFRQWRKGVERARGDLVWIAEADDDCDEIFLQTLLARMERDAATIGFTDSWQVGSNGERLGDSYRAYLSEEFAAAFEASFSVPGPEFAARFLSIKNVILNVSSVLFRKNALLDAMDAVGDELFGYRVAGDWRLYIELCNQNGAVVAYEAKPLNGHRRHETSVTHSLNNEKHFAEILDVQSRAEQASCALPDALLRTRAAYRRKVRSYLGLDGATGTEAHLRSAARLP